MRDVIYSEWVSAGLFVKTMITFVIIIVLCVLAITILTNVAFQNPFWIAVPSSVVAFLFLMFRNYRGLEIRVSDKELQVNYGIFNHKTIPPTHPMGTPIECGASNCGIRFNLHTLVERFYCPSCRGELELP